MTQCLVRPQQADEKWKQLVGAGVGGTPGKRGLPNLSLLVSSGGPVLVRIRIRVSSSKGKSV